MVGERSRINLPLNETKESILTHLLTDNQSAIDLEEKLGINESAIRRHLNTLEQQDYVEHYFERAGKGRPKKLYQITENGRKLFPQKTHLLFVILTRKVKEKYGEEDLEEILSEVAKNFANRLVPKSTKKTKEEKLVEFVDSLDRFGFYPELTEEDDFYKLKYRNCVFGEVIEDLCDQLCEMHRQIVKNVIPNCQVALYKTRGKGDERCVHRIKL